MFAEGDRRVWRFGERARTRIDLASRPLSAAARKVRP